MKEAEIKKNKYSKTSYHLVSSGFGQGRQHKPLYFSAMSNIEARVLHQPFGMCRKA